MKKRPNLILREPVKLYEPKKEETVEKNEVEKVEEQGISKTLIAESSNLEIQKSKEVRVTKKKNKESIKDKLPPRVGQIWEYFCRKAKSDGELKTVFSLTRAEVMKGAGIGSTNTYRDALKRFQDLDLLKIELRPGVNSGSIFTLTEKGIEQLD